MTDVALKFTGVPEHTVFPGLAVMVTETGKFGLTWAVMGLDVTVLPEAQVAFDIKVHVTTSPSIG